MISFELNGKPIEVDVDPTTPLLWVIRDHLNMTGTKFGCGIAQCGACTIHLNGAATRSCVLPISAVQGLKVETIEGLTADAKDKVAHVVQQTWLESNVVQCGYCQSGQIMSAVALLRTTKKPSDAQIDGAMSGNICRCATYKRIRAAIHTAANKLAKS